MAKGGREEPTAEPPPLCGVCTYNSTFLPCTRAGMHASWLLQGCGWPCKGLRLVDGESMGMERGTEAETHRGRGRNHIPYLNLLCPVIIACNYLYEVRRQEERTIIRDWAAQRPLAELQQHQGLAHGRPLFLCTLIICNVCLFHGIR